MKQRSVLWVLFSSLLFLAGILFEISLSATVAWGQIEAQVYAPQEGSPGLNLKCPLVLSYTESGVVSAVISNPLEEETLPVVTEDISRVSGEKQTSQTLTLEAHASQTLNWKVDSSDSVFGRLILVNIIQSQYRDLPSHQDACGILLLSLFSLSGIQTFSLLLFTGLAGIVIGAAIWRRERTPLDDNGRNLAQASSILAGVATAAILSSFARAWGLILFLDALAMIMIVVIFTELILFPGKLSN